MGPPARLAIGLLVAASTLPALDRGEHLLVLPPDLRTQALEAALTADPTVRWEASRASLAETLPLLQRGDHRVLLRLGADEWRPRRRPAAAGGWWTGILTLCRTYDLEVVPAAAPQRPTGGRQELPGGGATTLEVAGGPLVLAPADPDRRPIRSIVQGPLLVQVEHLSTSRLRGLHRRERWADLRIALRLHPAMDTALVPEWRLEWTGATCADRPLVLTLPGGPDAADRLLPDATGVDGSLRIGGLHPDDRRVVLSGEVVVQGRAPLQRQLSIARGERSNLRLDDLELAVALAADGDGGTLTIHGPATHPLEPTFSLRTVDAGELTTDDRTATVDGDRRRWTWHFAHLPQERLELHAFAEVDLGAVRLPLRCALELP